jgi:GntR family transcriptional regulator of abcA and norABC
MMLICSGIGGSSMINEWKPNRLDDKPIYKQIAEYIEYRISSGEFPPGSLLPSERTLANDLNVNRSTVVAAYDELRTSGLIFSKKGSGTRVSPFTSGKERLPNWNQYMDTGTFLPNIRMIRRILEETHHKNLLDLATGELSPELFPNEYFKQIIKNGEFFSHLGYENPQGNYQLRETIAEHVKQYKCIDSTASSVLITSGAQQALHLIVQCLLKPGDAVAIEDPSYCYSLPIFKSLGIKIHLLPVDENGINPNDLLDLYKKHQIRMVFLNPNFQNPTGTVLNVERRRKILTIALKYGIPIVEDDPYTLTSFEKEPIPTLKSMDHYGIVIYISSLSKILSSGLRIGWIIAPQPIIQRLTDVKQQIDFGQSIFPQWIANEFLISPFFLPHITKLREELKERRDILISSLRNYMPSHAEFFTPKGGIHLWCKLNPIINEEKLFETSITNGVIFVPGSVLGSKKGYVRFTYGRANKSWIEEAIYHFSKSYTEVLNSSGNQ